jgi:hypothetical protein
MTPEEKLNKYEVVFEKKSASHFVIEGKFCFIDYWPTTGKWKPRDHFLEGFGLNGLLEYIGVIE